VKAGTLLHGAKVYSELALTDGIQPVEQRLSQARCDVCTGRLTGTVCPHNESGYKLVESAAEWLRRQLEKKNELKLSTLGEERLFTCSACWCPLILKVHLPIEFIMQKVGQSELNSMPDWCWVKTETNPPQNV
jgi:hypothetical protein